MAKEKVQVVNRTVVGKWDAILFSSIILMFIAFSWMGLQRDIAQQDYLAHLTPAEREQLRLDAQVQAQAKAEADAAGAKAWRDFWNFPVPLWAIVVFVGFHFIWYLSSKLRRSY